MALWGMVIDLDRCTGCQACALACKAENNVPPVGPAEAERGRAIAWMQILDAAESTHVEAPPAGEAGGPDGFIPRPCFHCDDPPCTRVCPVNATNRTPEGIVTQIYSRCIGCRFCMVACPFNVKFFNWRRYATEGPGQNPDVSVRPKGVVEKCTFCHHRLQRAREQARAGGREMSPSEYVPACTEVCPTRAIAFGDLADPRSGVARLARSSRAFRFGEEMGTRPKVYYLRRRERHD
jgi:molybdopterin-containing oxidoreductase family iron-sulfur binding subunit